MIGEGGRIVDELTREANKLQGELLNLIELSGVPVLAKPMLRAIVGRLHYLHVSILQELNRREN